MIKRSPQYIKEQFLKIIIKTKSKSKKESKTPNYAKITKQYLLFIKQDPIEKFY